MLLSPSSLKPSSFLKHLTVKRRLLYMQEENQLLALLASTFKMELFHEFKLKTLLPAGSPLHGHRGAVEHSDQSQTPNRPVTSRLSKRVENCKSCSRPNVCLL